MWMWGYYEHICVLDVISMYALQPSASFDLCLGIEFPNLTSPEYYS